ncbi:MAG TPA: hypothetical protein VJB34_07000, partial [Bdellovibrionota bacterium]|nr:hypothetical protein [Bdellovibrionota bacterium]
MKKFFVFFFLSFLSLQISNQTAFANTGGLTGPYDDPTPFDRQESATEVYLAAYLSDFFQNINDTDMDALVLTITDDLVKGLGLSESDVQVAVMDAGEGRKQVNISIPTRLVTMELTRYGSHWKQTGIESVRQGDAGEASISADAMLKRLQKYDSGDEARMHPDARRRIIDNVIARATGVAPANWAEEEIAKLEAFEREQQAIRSEGHVRYHWGLDFLNEPPLFPLRLPPTLNNQGLVQYLRYYWARRLKITDADLEVSVQPLSTNGAARTASIKVLGIADGVTVEKWGKSLTAQENEVARVLLAKTQDGWVEVEGGVAARSKELGVFQISGSVADEVDLAKAFADSVDLANYHRKPDPLDPKRAEDIAAEMAQDLFTVLRFRIEGLGLDFQSSRDVYHKIYQSVLRNMRTLGTRNFQFYGGRPTGKIWGETLDLNHMWRDIVSLEEHINQISLSLDRLEAFGTAEGVELGLVKDGYLTKKGARVLESLKASLQHRLGSLDGLAEKLFQVNGTWLTDFETDEASVKIFGLKLTQDGPNGKDPVTMMPQAIKLKPWMFHVLAKRYGTEINDLLTRMQNMEPVSFHVLGFTDIGELGLLEPRAIRYEVHPRDFQLSWSPGMNTLETYVAKYAKIARRVAKYNPGMFRIMTYERAQHVMGWLSRVFGRTGIKGPSDKDGKPKPPQGGEGRGTHDVVWGAGADRPRGSGTGPSSMGGTGGLAIEAYPQGDGTFVLETPLQSVSRLVEGV